MGKTIVTLSVAAITTATVLIVKKKKTEKNITNICKKCGIEIMDNNKHKLCVDCRKERNENIKIAAKFVALYGAVKVGEAIVTVLSKEEISGNDDYVELEFTDSDFDTNEVCEVVKDIKRSPRYKVEYKTLKTDEWYTKTETDYLNSAVSVARCNNFGRAYRITDTMTGDILEEEERKR